MFKEVDSALISADSLTSRRPTTAKASLLNLKRPDSKHLFIVQFAASNSSGNKPVQNAISNAQDSVAAAITDLGNMAGDVSLRACSLLDYMSVVDDCQSHTVGLLCFAVPHNAESMSEDPSTCELRACTGYRCFIVPSVEGITPFLT